MGILHHYKSCWPTPGPFRGSLGPPGHPKTPVGGPGGPWAAPGTWFDPKCHWLVQLGGPHPYHVLGPLKRPLRHSRGPQRAKVFWCETIWNLASWVMLRIGTFAWLTRSECRRHEGLLVVNNNSIFVLLFYHTLDSDLTSLLEPSQRSRSSLDTLARDV